MCCTASILSLCALGWERWCGISAPLARARRARLARMYAALVWPVALAVALPTAFITTPKHVHEGEIDKACPENTNVAYVFFSTILSFYLPATVMLVLYARILYALASPPTIRSHRGQSLAQSTQETAKTSRSILPSISKIGISFAQRDAQKPQEESSTTTPKKRHLNLPDRTKPDTYVPTPVNKARSLSAIVPRQRRATKTIVKLMSLFLVCWTPFFIMLPVDSLCDCVWDTTWQWCTWLGYTNSALNPLVYAAASPSVRRALRASLTSSSTRNATEAPVSSGARRT